MDTLQIGALAIPVDRLPGVAALAALLVAAALVSRDHPLLRVWSTEAMLLGILGARAGFVAFNYPVYAADPLAVLYIWQGGFVPVAGAAVVLPYTFWRLRRDTGALLHAAAPLGAAGAAFLAATLAAVWLKPEPRPIPEVTLQTLQGEKEPLQSHTGNPLVINLWATWCPPCRRELPMLAELADAETDATILMVNQGEPHAHVAQYLAGVGLTGRAVRLDPASRTSRALGVQAYPTTLVYDAAGRLVKRMSGEVSRAAVHSAIAKARDRE